jgi:hypothetical protein
MNNIKPLWIAIATEPGSSSEVVLAIRAEDPSAKFLYDFEAIESLEKLLKTDPIEFEIYAFNFSKIAPTLKQYGLDEDTLSKISDQIKDPVKKAEVLDKSWLGDNFEMYLEHLDFDYVGPQELAQKAWNTKLIYDGLEK